METIVLRRVLLFVCIAFCVQTTQSAKACLWDRDTLRDELENKSSIYDVVMGQFAHHGKAYYEARVKKLWGRQDLTFLEKNDLAVALIRLEHFDKAENILLILDKEKEGKVYEVKSNLGILYKKQGDYGKAADYIKEALALKPEGHMGLGDWYLKRIEWDRDRKKVIFPENNFLGEPYKKGDGKFDVYPGSKMSEENKERANYLVKLILNDREFADAYVVFGDVLLKSGELHLAMRAYQRAQHLDHPNKNEVQRRIDAVLFHWKGGLYDVTKLSTVEKGRISQKNAFSAESQYIDKWHASFDAAEAALVKKGEFPGFTQTISNMSKNKYYPTKLKKLQSVQLEALIAE